MSSRHTRQATREIEEHVQEELNLDRTARNAEAEIRLAIAQRTLDAIEEKMNRDRLSDEAKMNRERLSDEAKMDRERINHDAFVANNLAESQARIAGLSVDASARTTAGLTVDDDAGEYPEEVKNLSLSLPGLPRQEIAKIFNNTFRPQNLYKLRMVAGFEDSDRDSNLAIVAGEIKLLKPTGSFKDFGPTPAIWSQTFLNYARVLAGFYTPTHPLLVSALLGFHEEIIELSRIYKWQDAVLPVAIQYHVMMTMETPLDHSKWLLPRSWVDRYCTSTKTLSSKSGPSILPADHTNKRKRAETTPAICRKYNLGLCSVSGCRFKHICAVENCGGAHSEKNHK